MQTSTNAGPSVFNTSGNGSDRQARILARSIYKDLKSYGISHEKILEIASRLIGHVTEDLKETD